MQNLFHEDQTFFAESPYYEICMSAWYLLLFKILSSIYDSFLQITLVVVFQLRNLNILDQR